MKTVFKLHIIFVLLLSVSLFASHVNNSLHKKESSRKILNSEQTHPSVYAVRIIAIDRLDQEDNKSQTKIYISIYNAPEFFGGFENYFSTPTILSDIRTDQRFSRQLKI